VGPVERVVDADGGLLELGRHALKLETGWGVVVALGLAQTGGGMLLRRYRRRRCEWESTREWDLFI
jgi:hypothetical protein